MSVQSAAIACINNGLWFLEVNSDVSILPQRNIPRLFEMLMDYTKTSVPHDFQA